VDRENGPVAGQADHTSTAAEASVIIVVFGQTSLDLAWIPHRAQVFVVHNDDMLADDACHHPDVRHLHPGSNIGFGSGVNLALREVTSRRVVVCNPDMALDRAHFEALSAGHHDEIVTVPVAASSGRPMASVVPYPSPILLLAGTFRVMRLAPPGTVRRAVLAKALGGWGEERRWSVVTPAGRFPLRSYWIPGAVFSVDTDLLRSVGGFDEHFFLYLEDTDLCRRLAAVDAGLVAVVAAAPAGFHAVGGSAHDDATVRLVRRSQWQSAVRYASGQSGWAWRGAAMVLRCGAFLDRSLHRDPA
jgi:GT2 family glycosyltransferase